MVSVVAWASTSLQMVRNDGAGILYAANGDRERLTYFEGRLMKREVLPPGQPPAVQNKSRPGIFCEVLISQDRIGCLQPTVLTETSGRQKRTEKPRSRSAADQARLQ